MNPLSRDFASGLFETSQGPCLSLYQPTHRPATKRQEDQTRFKNLVRELEGSLRQGYAAADVEAALAPFRALAEDGSFWRGALKDGLAVFGARGIFRVYRLQREVPELALAASSFHVKPLLRILQSADNFTVLGINRERMRLFEGNRDELDEISLPEGFPSSAKDVLGEQEHKRFVEAWAPQVGKAGVMHGGGDAGAGIIRSATERFFRAVDDAVLEAYSRPSRQPLLLVGLPENLAIFRNISRNRFLLEKAIERDLDSLSLEALRQEAWQTLEPFYLARLAKLRDRFQEAYANERADSDVAKVARSAVEGRVETLLVDADRKEPGRLDAQGGIERETIEHPEVDDLLDDIAQQVLRSGGEVVVVPAGRMPTETGLAAIYRF